MERVVELGFKKVPHIDFLNHIESKQIDQKVDIKEKIKSQQDVRYGKWFGR